LAASAVRGLFASCRSNEGVPGCVPRLRVRRCPHHISRILEHRSLCTGGGCRPLRRTLGRSGAAASATRACHHAVCGHGHGRTDAGRRRSGKARGANAGTLAGSRYRRLFNMCPLLCGRSGVGRSERVLFPVLSNHATGATATPLGVGRCAPGVARADPHELYYGRCGMERRAFGQPLFRPTRVDTGRVKRNRHRNSVHPPPCSCGSNHVQGTGSGFDASVTFSSSEALSEAGQYQRKTGRPRHAGELVRGWFRARGRCRMAGIRAMRQFTPDPFGPPSAATQSEVVTLVSLQSDDWRIRMYGSRGRRVNLREHCHIVLAGHFDPASMAPLVSGEGSVQLAALSGTPGVPIHQLAREFVKRSLQTTLLGGFRGDADIRVKSSPLSAIVYGKRGRAAWIVDGLRRERNLVLEHLRKLEPSVVHAHWTLEAARAVADWDGPKVLTVHDAAWECARLGTRWNWGPLAHASTFRWLANTSAVLKRFRHVIAVSPFVEDYLRLKHHFHGEIRVIPNVVPALPDGTRIPETFPKTGRLTFGCCGGRGRLKNVDSAIRAFVHVYKELPNSRLLVFGAGWEKARAQYAGLPIEFRGAQPHGAFLNQLAGEIDIFVHPSRIETHGIAICEAIQAGCPVIAGRASGAVPWTLDYGRAGVLVDIENPIAIAEAMLTLTRDRNLALELVSYGRQMIRNRFSPEQVVEMHLRFYRDIIQEWEKEKYGIIPRGHDGNYRTKSVPYTR
jgi:L-malate glycosyltransferase